MTQSENSYCIEGSSDQVVKSLDLDSANIEAQRRRLDKGGVFLGHGCFAHRDLSRGLLSD
jgi:hypothetical protein